MRPQFLDLPPDVLLEIAEGMERRGRHRRRAGLPPQPVVEFWDLISRQDWEVCARAQLGVSSRAFTRGVYPRQDRFLYWFNEEWRVKMGRQPLG